MRIKRDLFCYLTISVPLYILTTLKFFNIVKFYLFDNSKKFKLFIYQFNYISKEEGRYTMNKFLSIIFLLVFILSPVATANSSSNNQSNFDSISINGSIDYYINISPIGNHSVGEVIFINGTTDLPVSDNLSLDITPSRYNPSGHGASFTANVDIQKGIGGVNTWFCNITPPIYWVPGHGFQQQTFTFQDFPSDEYGAVVESKNYHVMSVQQFTILSKNRLTTQLTISIPTTLPTTLSSSDRPTDLTGPATTSLAAPLSFLITTVALAGIVILIIVKKKKGI